METPLPEIKNDHAVAARQCYPNRDTLVSQFDEQVDSGNLALVLTDRDHATVNSTTWDFADKYPSIDFSYLEAGQTYDYETVLAGIPADQQSEFIAGEEAKLRGDCFQVNLSQRANAWWIGIDSKKDAFSWLDSATLHSVHEIKVGQDSFFINDFSGNIDIKPVIEGLGNIARMLEEHGLNLGKLFNVLNIQPEDFADFEVPERIKEKNPELFVAATANKQRRILTFNEKSFIGREFNGEGNDFTVANGWGPTFVHEFGHFLNMGLSDFSDASYAEEIGWATRRSVTVDDFGSQHSVASKGGMPQWGDYITDDMGAEVFISAAKSAKILVEGHTDDEGKTITPPSDYGATNDAEDIAESFTAYFFAPERLDGTRKAMVERLIADNATDASDPRAVEVSSISLNDFDPWKSVLPKEIGYMRTYAGPYKHPAR